MYGRSRPKKVFCKFHPTKKCDYFCRDHRVLLCTQCLRDKHRDCHIADDHEFKNFYGKKVKEATMMIETEKNELVSQTHTVISAIDASIARLEKYKKELDAVIDRMGDMKYEVEVHKNEMHKTTKSLQEIDRQMNNSYDIRTCQQCYADVDLEKIKFERKQRKLFQVPTRLNEEVDATLNSLQRKLKTIRNGITSQLSSTIFNQQHGNTRSYREASSYYLPFHELQHKIVNKRPKNHSKAEGRLSKWPNQDDDPRYKTQSRFPALY